MRSRPIRSQFKALPLMGVDLQSLQPQTVKIQRLSLVQTIFSIMITRML